jgi:hypothetical protein
MARRDYPTDVRSAMMGHDELYNRAADAVQLQPERGRSSATVNSFGVETATTPLRCGDNLQRSPIIAQL